MQSPALRLSTLLTVLLVLVACRDDPVQPANALAGSAVAPANAQSNHPAVDIYRVTLSPLNESGVHGTVILRVTGSDLFVQLNAVGHVPDLLHVQHIHGFADGSDATCPPPDADGGDGVLSFTDGLPFYGPVQLNLTPFPTPTNSAGSIQYHASFASAGLDFSPSDLELKTIVLHGDFVGDEFVGSLPVACGLVEAVN